MNTLSLQEFESEKNKKALLYTILVCAVFLLLAIFYTWQIAGPPVQNDQMDLIEINLGNDQEGFGDIQPLVKGEMAPDDQSLASVQSSRKAEESPSRQINTDENGDPDAAPVIKNEKEDKNARDINRKSASTASRTINPSPVTNPVPAPPQPKNLYKGGTGTGGNNADEDNGYRNQGYKPGASGDMGSPNGKPDSYGTSPGGRSGGGISISRGLTGRRMVSFPNLKGDFNENAKVYVDIVVNAAGRVISANIGKGTTTANPTLRNIAMAKARDLKFNPTTTGNNETGTMLFHFVLEN